VVQSLHSALPLHIKGAHVGVNIRSAVSERVCPLSYTAAGVAVVQVLRWYGCCVMVRCCGVTRCYIQPLYSGFGTARCGQFQGEPLPEMANTSFGIEATVNVSVAGQVYFNFHTVLSGTVLRIFPGNFPGIVPGIFLGIAPGYLPEQFHIK